MAVQRPITTAEEFDTFIQRADLGDRIYEYIAGEIVEVPSNPFASKIAATILIALGIFLKGKNWGHLTGEAGLYMVAGERYAPDVAYISRARQPELAREGANPNPPELAVEVISDESNAQEQRELRLKLSNYLAAGTMVWVVYPVSQLVEVHRPGKPVQLIGMEGTLDGGDALPGFTLAVREIFGE
jgi:Uma2 family endonuclease